MPDLFVTPDRLAEWHDDREDVVVVDVRDEWTYPEGHLPGAVHVPFDEFRDPTDETPGKLPTAEGFADLLKGAGISREDTVVAYDDDCGVYASRLLVTMEVYGHDLDRLRLLDGDYTTWERDRPVSTETLARQETTYRCEWVADGPLIDAEGLEAALDTDAVVVDTRDPVEYDTVHLPSAVNFQWRDLVDEDRRRLKPAVRRREILADHDITLDRPVRLYCNTARRLSFVYAVLRDLGHDDVAIYEGGIDTWAAYGGPLATTT